MNRGFAMHLIVSLLVSVFIIGLTFLLGSQKSFAFASLMNRIKTEYQMESAVILAFHDLKHKPEQDVLNKSVPKQTVAPATFLTYAIRRESAEKYVVQVQIEGPNLKKGLNAVFLRPGATPVASGEASLPASDWAIRYHPGQ